MEELEQVAALKEQVARLYRDQSCTIHPRHPYVLVRVIPKDNQQIRVAENKVLYLPDKVQNKPIYEGQVLEIYAPWTEPAKQNGAMLVHTCELAAGDHVAFQHHWGVPVPLDGYRGDYRLIEDFNLVGVLEYSHSPVKQKLVRLLHAYLQQRGDEATNEVYEEIFAQELMERFAVVECAQAKTLSGA